MGERESEVNGVVVGKRRVKRRENDLLIILSGRVEVLV